MKLERLNALIVTIGELCQKESMIRMKQNTTTTGSNAWRHYADQIEDVRAERRTLWEEIRQAIMAEEK